MKKLIVHIGIGKTGTSSIQKMLMDNKILLDNNYYYYPSIAGSKDAHHYLANYHLSNLDDKIRVHLNNIIQVFKRNDYKVLLLSSEQFCYCKNSYVKEFSSYFHDWDVRVIFYVRKQFKLIKSTFLQKLVEGSAYSDDIVTFFNESKIGFNYLNRVKSWDNYFGANSIDARLFDGKENVCQDFIEAAGLNKLEIHNSSYNVNQSILPDFVQLISLINGLDPCANDRRDIFDNIKDLSLRFKECSRALLLDDDLIFEIENYYKVSNEKFAERYLCEVDRDMFLN